MSWFMSVVKSFPLSSVFDSPLASRVFQDGHCWGRTPLWGVELLGRTAQLLLGVFGVESGPLPHSGCWWTDHAAPEAQWALLGGIISAWGLHPAQDVWHIPQQCPFLTWAFLPCSYCSSKPMAWNLDGLCDLVSSLPWVMSCGPSAVQCPCSSCAGQWALLGGAIGN